MSDLLAGLATLAHNPIAILATAGPVVAIVAALTVSDVIANELAERRARDADRAAPQE